MRIPAASTRLQSEQQSIDEIDRRLEELEGQLKHKLLIDDNAAVAKLDADIAGLKRKAEHHRLRKDSLTAQVAIEAKAEARKQTQELIERIEAAFDERVKNGQAITRTIAKLIELVANDISLSKKIMPAWPWNNSDREALMPWGQGIRRLLCYEFYKQSAQAFMDNVADSQITLPGSVCEVPDNRLQPHKIESLNDRLKGIAAHASGVMRRQAGIPKETEEQRKAS